MSPHSASKSVLLELVASGAFTAPLAAQPAVAGATVAAGAQPAPTGPVRRLSVDDAVRLALEQNLINQVERVNPQISDLSVALARTAWTPAINTTVTATGRDAPVSSFLSGAQDKATSRLVSTAVTARQALPWGGNASVSWDGSRFTTNNQFSNFNPTLQSTLALQYTQPLLRNLTIDAARQQPLFSRESREISDVCLKRTTVTIVRDVKHAYWDLAHAVASRGVQEQSLELARQSLRETRARVEVGTLPAIHVVAAEAEVAQREESVIVADARWAEPVVGVSAKDSRAAGRQSASG